ncbi:hypothetical protein MGSAQ_002465 [marine sediment metagenome]|uniref:Uncharacterized protein n=1 Tax=marine sediment metagenome TaxID=412755 RepID=A0A1B6NRT7_9ZZZZ
MDAIAGGRERQEGRLVQQAFQVKVRTFANQFELEDKGLRQRLASLEFEHL